MDELKKEAMISVPLLEMVTRFYEGIYTGSGEGPVQTILSEAARVFQADIATWFLVTENQKKLRLIDVYNDLGKPAERPPVEPYELNWEATSENEVSGLTAWVAVSGEALYVPSFNILVEQHGKCHAGRWDDWLYPGGIDHPESGFLCMYAVPLVLPLAEGRPQKKVVGVLKMERRRMKDNRKREKFKDTEIESFNVIARIMGFAYFHNERQKTLTLADIGHALIRPLGDVAVSLDAVALDFSEESFNIEHAKVQVESASIVLRSLSRIMSIAKESYHDPVSLNSVDVYADLEPQGKAIYLSSGREIKISRKKVIGKIEMAKHDHAALLNIAINLLQNAAQNAPFKSQVEMVINRTDKELILIVKNQGIEVRPDILDSARQKPDTHQSFRGLPRSFQLAAQKNWELLYHREDQKNCFQLKVPVNFKEES